LLRFLICSFWTFSARLLEYFAPNVPRMRSRRCFRCACAKDYAICIRKHRLNAALTNINKDDIVSEIVIFQLNSTLYFVKNRRFSRIWSSRRKESEETCVKHVESLHASFARLSTMG